MLVRLVQLQKALPDAGDAIRNRDARQAGAARKASSPMLVTPLPIVMLVRLVQSEKASSPMLVTLSGIVMLVRLVQLGRHIPDAGDAIRNRDARQAGAV